MNNILVFIQVLFLVCASVASYYLSNKKYQAYVFLILIILSSYTAYETLKFQNNLKQNSEITVERTGNIQKFSAALVDHTGKLVQNIEGANKNLNRLKNGFEQLGLEQKKLLKKSETINTNLENVFNQFTTLDDNINEAKDDIDIILQQNNNLKSIIEYFNREFPLTKDKLLQIVTLSNQAQSNLEKTLENQTKLIEQGQNIQYSMADLEKSLSKIDAVYNFVTNIQSIKTSDRQRLISMVGEIRGTLPNISRPAPPQNLRIGQ